MAEPQRGVLAAARDEIASRGLVLDAQYPSFVPPSTYCVAPPGLLGQTATAWSATTKDRQYMFPFMVGRSSWVCSGAVVQISTASVGGTTPLVRIGLYPMDSATGYPDTGAGPLREGSLVPTAAGNQTITWAGGNITLASGTYWVGVIYTNATAPTTYPAAACINNCSWYMPVSSGPSVGVSRALYLTGQATFKTTATAPTAWVVTGGADCPVAYLRAA